MLINSIFRFELLMFFIIYVITCIILSIFINQIPRRAILVISDVFYIILLIIQINDNELGNSNLYFLSLFMIPLVINTLILPLYLKEVFLINFSQMCFQALFCLGPFVYYLILDELTLCCIFLAVSFLRFVHLINFFESPFYLLKKKSNDEKALKIIEYFFNGDNVRTFLNFMKSKANLQRKCSLKELFNLHRSIISISFLFLLNINFTGIINILLYNLPLLQSNWRLNLNVINNNICLCFCRFFIWDSDFSLFNNENFAKSHFNHNKPSFYSICHNWSNNIFN